MKTKVILLNIVMTILILPSIGIIFPIGLRHTTSDPNLLDDITTFFAALLPIMIIVTQIKSWISFYKQNYDLAFKINALPWYNFLIIIFLLLFSVIIENFSS